MGYWTYPNIILTVKANIFMSRWELLAKSRQLMENAPKITGDDGDAFVSALNHESGGAYFYERTERQIWDRFNIVIIGHLRNRFKEQTLEEVNAFINYINEYKGGMFTVVVDVKNIKGYSKKIIENAD